MSERENRRGVKGALHNKSAAIRVLSSMNSIDGMNSINSTNSNNSINSTNSKKIINSTKSKNNSDLMLWISASATLCRELLLRLLVAAAGPTIQHFLGQM